MKFIKLLTKCLFIVIFSLSLYNEMKSVCNLGSLSNRQNYGLPSDSYPQSIAFSPIFNGNLFAAVANSNTNYLSTYSVDQTTGTFTEISSSIGTGGLPSGVAFSPITSGGNLFAAVSNSGGGVTVYSVDQSGNFITINTYNAGSQPSAVAFSPIVNGNLFAAVTNGGTSGSNGVTVYTVDESTGVFSTVGNYITGYQPSSVAFSPITPNGDLFAAVANYASNNISFYQVDTSTGVFNSLGTYQSSSTASCISVSFSPITTNPTGNLFVAVANYSFTDNSVTIYQVNTQNSSLDLINTYGAGTSPHGVAFSSVVSGSLFLGIANQLSSNISMYTVDQSAGTLTSVANYATNQYPYSVAFSPLTTTGHLFVGTANYGGNNITVYSVETAPTVSITVNSANVCVGTSIMLTAVALGGSGNYTYSWTLPDGGTSSDNPLIISSATSSDGGPYQVTVTDSNGCQGISDPVQVTVYSRPEVTIQPSNILSTCVGESVTFTAVASGGSGDFAYQWFDSNGDLVSTTNILSPDTSTADVFDYTFQLTDTVTQCSLGITLIRLTVNPNPTVTISSAPSTACYGGNAILTANVSGGSGSYSYAWTLNGSSVGSDSSTLTVSDIIPGTNDGAYQVTVTDTTTTCNATSASFTIPVDQVSVTLNSSSTAVCQGTSITLTANVTSGVSPYTYDWYQDGSLLVTTSDNVYTINNLDAGTYTYQVIVTDSNPCQGTSNSVSITVNSNPTVTITPDPASVCSGGDITLTATASGGSGTYDSYSWTTPTGTSNDNPLVISNATSADAGSYQVTVTDSNSCTGSDSSIVSVGSLTVNVLPDPDPVCPGSTITLTANVAGGTAPYSYNWTGPNNFTSASNPVVISNASSSNAGTYQVTVTDFNGCTGTDSSEVTIDNVNVTITPNPDRVCLGSTVILTANVSSGIEPYIYQWTGPNNYTFTGNPAVITNMTSSKEGTYTVTVIDSVGCKGQATDQVILDQVGVSVVPSSLSVCPGSTIDLTANVTSGIVPYTYQWIGPNGFSSTDQSISITNANEANAGTYQVIVTDSNGCRGTASAQVSLQSTQVVIVPDPAVVAPGSSIILRADVICGQGPLTYQWTGPNGFTSDNQIITISNANGSNTGTYTLTVTDVNGNTITETIEIRLDNLSVDIVSSTLNIRQGQTISLIAEPKDGQSPYSYQWFGPAVTRTTSYQLISTDQKLVINNATTANSGTYTVVMTDNYGFTASYSVNVTVRASSSLSSAIASKYCS